MNNFMLEEMFELQKQLKEQKKNIMSGKNEKCIDDKYFDYIDETLYGNSLPVINLNLFDLPGAFLLVKYLDYVEECVKCDMRVTKNASLKAIWQEEVDGLHSVHKKNDISDKRFNEVSQKLKSIGEQIEQRGKLKIERHNIRVNNALLECYKMAKIQGYDFDNAKDVIKVLKRNIRGELQSLVEIEKKYKQEFDKAQGKPADRLASIRGSLLK